MEKNKKDSLAVFIILAAVGLAYFNNLSNPFIFDDRLTIVENNYIKHWETLPNLFTNKITSFPIAKGMWRPLLMLSFAFNYFFSGLNPYSYHLINILLHFLNAILLYLLLKIFLARERFKTVPYKICLGLTIIFCLHPINTEAVTYISSRSVTMCGFFILSGLYSYVRGRESQQRHLYVLSLGCYILALLTKEIALILPMLIFAYELAYNKTPQKEKKSLFLRLLPFALITLGYLVLIKFIFGEVFGLFGKSKSMLAIRPFSSNILTQSAVSFFYLYLFFYPFNLCVDHNFPIISSLNNPLGAIPLTLIIILILTALSLRKRLPLIALSIFWYLICLLPQFYGRLNIVAAEHHPYVAYFAVYFIIGYVLLKWKAKKEVLRLLFIFILGLFFILTLIRNFQWQDEYILWKAELKANPGSEIAKGSLGLYLVNKGIDLEGEEYLKQAIGSKKNIASYPSILNLAAYYARFKNQPEKALELLTQYRDRLLKQDSLRYLNTLGIVYTGMGRKQEARKAWEDALKLYPELPEIKANLGWWYIDNYSDTKKAKEYFLDALKDNPDSINAHLGLGMVFEKENLPKKAIEEYEKSIRINAADPKAYYRLGTVYAQKLLDAKAEWYFKKTVELAPDFAPGYYNLCVLYLSLPKPDYPKAREYFNQAKELGFKTDEKIERILEEKPEKIEAN
ncbi:MAG: tetratricopeptide repeat protein [Candidatus Omnitrophota bacterium]|nr:tetratricopeptide repeat protein [Candidatus Omnitrophota bacterium]